jgi:hypothetical protein
MQKPVLSAKEMQRDETAFPILQAEEIGTARECGKTELWFGRKSDEPCALMVSFNEDSRDSASAAQIVSSLQAESKARDVAVFPHFSETSYSDGNSTVRTNHRPEGQLASTFETRRFFITKPE